MWRRLTEYLFGSASGARSAPEPAQISPAQAVASPPANVTVRAVEGAPYPDSVEAATLTYSNARAVLRFPAADASDGGEVEATFTGVSRLAFGWPNDEALHGHRLWGTGLTFYAIQEVLNSDWIDELERGNSVHRQHRPGAFRNSRHIIITFKEDTFEFVCRSMELTRTKPQQQS